MAEVAPSLSTTAKAILHGTPQTYSFHFSPFLRRAHQVGLPPDRPICKAFNTGHCPNGTRCHERHVTDPKLGGSGAGGPTGGLNSLVCKHWLRGLCKKGEHCEFLHEYNLRKMPECNFFMRNGYCSNGDECLYLHIDPMSRLPPCPHYDMGFCPLGPNCSKKHVRRKPCPFYLAGFCPDGPDCKVGGHPKWSKDLDRPIHKSEKKEEDDLATAARIEAARLAAAEEEREGRDGGDGGSGGGNRFGRHDRGGRGGWRGRGGGRGRGFRGGRH